LSVVPSMSASTLSWKLRKLPFPSSYNPLIESDLSRSPRHHYLGFTFRSPIKVLQTDSCEFNPYLVSYSTSLSKQRGVYTLTRNRILPSSGMELPFARRRDTHWLTTLQGRTSLRAQLPASPVTRSLLDWFVFLPLIVVQCLSSRKETDMSPYRSASISFRFRLTANRS